jgi:MFS family permease
VVGGVLADRLGRRATLLVSLFGGAAATLLLGLSRGTAALGAAAFLMGLVAEMYRPAVSAMIADIVPPEERGRAFSHLYWVINLGFAVAPPLAALAAQTRYLALFAVDAATTAAYGLVIWRRVPETRPSAAQKDGPTGSALGTLASDGAFLGFVGLLSLSALVMWQNGTALPLDMLGHGVSATAYGALMGINGAIIVVAQPFMTRWLAGRRRPLVLAAASLLFGVGFGLYGVVSTRAGYALAIALWTIGEIALLPTASAVVADLSPAGLRGRYQGVYSMAWGVASTLGPLVGGAFLERSRARYLWAGCFGTMVLVAIGHLRLGRALLRRAPQVSGSCRGARRRRPASR